MKIDRPYKESGDDEFRKKAKNLAEKAHKEGLDKVDFGTLFDQNFLEEDYTSYATGDLITVKGEDAIVILNEPSKKSITVEMIDTEEMVQHDYDKLNNYNKSEDLGGYTDIMAEGGEVRVIRYISKDGDSYKWKIDGLNKEFSSEKEAINYAKSQNLIVSDVINEMYAEGGEIKKIEDKYNSKTNFAEYHEYVQNILRENGHNDLADKLLKKFNSKRSINFSTYHKQVMNGLKGGSTYAEGGKVNSSKRVGDGHYLYKGKHIMRWVGSQDTMWHIWNDEYGMDEYQLSLNSKKEAMEFIDKNVVDYAEGGEIGSKIDISITNENHATVGKAIQKALDETIGGSFEFNYSQSKRNINGVEQVMKFIPNLKYFKWQIGIRPINYDGLWYKGYYRIRGIGLHNFKIVAIKDDIDAKNNKNAQKEFDKIVALFDKLSRIKSEVKPLDTKDSEYESLEETDNFISYTKGSTYAEGGKVNSSKRGGYFKDGEEFKGWNHKAKEVWNGWSADQRKHFMHDHQILRGNQSDFNRVSLYKFDELYSPEVTNQFSFRGDVQDSIIDHIRMGKYEKGGSTYAEGGGVSIDWEIDVYINLEDTGWIETINVVAKDKKEAIKKAKELATETVSMGNQDEQDATFRVDSIKSSTTNWKRYKDYAEGGEVEMIEIAEDGSNVPPKLMEIFSEFNEDEDHYKEMERLKVKANEIGYDFDYGLDGTPTEFCEIPKKSWGGGIAIGTAVGGYVGYKIGRARTQKFGFETEKKIGKGIKNTFSRKKKMSQGGSFSSYFDGKLSFLNY